MRLIISWMRRNYWLLDRTNKHSVWMLKIENPNTSDILLYDTLVLNEHRTKGQGISESDFKKLAEKMKIKKDVLKELINNKKDINYQDYIENNHHGKA